MDTEAQNILNKRLASGDISEQEYNRLWQRMFWSPFPETNTDQNNAQQEDTAPERIIIIPKFFLFWVFFISILLTFNNRKIGNLIEILPNLSEFPTWISVVVTSLPNITDVFILFFYGLLLLLFVRILRKFL